MLYQEFQEEISNHIQQIQELASSIHEVIDLNDYVITVFYDFDIKDVNCELFKKEDGYKKEIHASSVPMEILEKYIDKCKDIRNWKDGVGQLKRELL